MNRLQRQVHAAARLPRLHTRHDVWWAWCFGIALGASLVAMAGCAPPPIDPSRFIDAPPGADQATVELTKMWGRTPYPITWFSPEPGEFADGWTDEAYPFQDGRTYVAWKPGMAIHETSLTHEWLHGRLPTWPDHPADLYGADYATTLIDGGECGRGERRLADMGL